MSWLDKVAASKPSPQISQPDQSQSWFDIQDLLFEDRLRKYIDLGLSEGAGKGIALRLFLRDFDNFNGYKDDRTLCFECTYLTSYSDSWRCKNYIKAGISSRESGSGLGDMVNLLQRCNGFTYP
jgi:hypothetical protein